MQLENILTPVCQGKPVDYYLYPNSDVPVFCPTMEQFTDFESFVGAIEPLALLAGVCKVIPPAEWRHRLVEQGQPRVVLEDSAFPIMKPIQQHFNGSRGTFHQYNVEYHKRLKLSQFFQMSQQDHLISGKQEDEEEADDVCEMGDKAGIVVDYAEGKVRLTRAAAAQLREAVRSDAQRDKFVAASFSYQPRPTAGERDGEYAEDGRPLFVGPEEYEENEEMERIYWKNITFQPPLYGADVLGSLFPELRKMPIWNIRRLPGVLRRVGQRVPGVNDPYLYLGMWKATFAWHVEDMDLYSINYIHFGAPKAWYSIGLESKQRFEETMQNVFAGDYRECSQFMRHKAFVMSPRCLGEQGIKVNRVVQRAGEIMLTFPGGYHAGFNHGFNCAESVNFALDRWLEVAWQSKHCECVKDSVTIDLMEWFGDVKPKERADEMQPRRHAAADVVVKKRGRPPKRKLTKGSAAQMLPPAKRQETEGYGSLYNPVGMCGGCLRGISKDAEMVECRQCGLTVHEGCSALSADDGQYRCANCVMDTDQLSCLLCKYQNGLLLPARGGGGFVHFLCASFIAEALFEFPSKEDKVRTRSMATMSGSAKIKGLDKIDAARYKGKCVYGCMKGERCPVVKCGEKKCLRTFHPMCAAVMDPGLLDWAESMIYCPSHRKHF